MKLEDALFNSTDTGTVAARRVDNVREIVKQLERFEERTKAKLQKEARENAPAGFADRSQPAEADDDDDDDLFGIDETEPATLGGFLADMALGSRDDGQTQEERDDQVVLSTIHAAKGLEWEHVFVVGAEEELMPHQRTLEGDGEIEEERRLAYVAVTRARKKLVVSWARARTRWGREVKRTRSRFLEGLPASAVEMLDGEIPVVRTEEEKDEIARRFMAEIRSKLGM